MSRDTGTTRILRAARRMVICAVMTVCAFPWAGSDGIIHAQQADHREVRAVWLTTLQGLDWPQASTQSNPQRQQRALLAILDNLQRLNINTVIFQVRSRGNAFYASQFEPWASELSGVLGKDPGWDPLQFAIDECRKRGLVLHAWINVFKVWSGEGPPPRTALPHVIHTHPEWVRRYDTDGWIDPGIPEARKYLVDVCADIADRYDVDALHLDYTRYPEADFADHATYRARGGHLPKAEWRRRNVDAFVRDLSIRVRRFKPKMLIGAAPIGIYRNLPTARGWQGYEALGQDSRRWISEGWIDYIAPQIYWGLSSRGSNIDFEALVRDWKENCAGRHVYVGTAPYKPEVKLWLGEIIDVTRAQGADGQVFFRYEHVRTADVFQGRYIDPALPPAVVWRDNIRPNPPQNLDVKAAGTARTVSWSPPVRALDGDDPRWYVVYRFPTSVGPMPFAIRLLAILPAEKTRFWDPHPCACDYAVTSVDRLGNESSLPMTIASTERASLRIPAPSLAVLPPLISDPVLTVDASIILLAYSLPDACDIRIRLLEENGSEAMILVDERKGPGTYVIGIERDKLPDDIVRYVFEAGRQRTVKDFRF